MADRVSLPDLWPLRINVVVPSPAITAQSGGSGSNTTTPTAAAAAASSSSSLSSTIRIIDTLLWDSSTSTGTTSHEDTAQELAHAILTDMEVQGMSRSSRNFVGRLDLYSPKAVALIAEQILQQLQAFDALQYQQAQREWKHVLEERFQQKQRWKRQQKQEEEEDAQPAAFQRSRTEKQGETKSQDEDGDEKVPASDQPTGDETQPENASSMGRESSCTPQEKRETQPLAQSDKTSPPSSSSQQEHQQRPSSLSSSSTTTTSHLAAGGKKKTEKVKVKRPRTLVPIRLRMVLPLPYGIRIHDDFDWDCSLQHVYTPLHMATDLVRDLNLPQDAIIAIAIEISEQILGKTLSLSQQQQQRTAGVAADYHGWPEDAQLLYKTLQQRSNNRKDSNTRKNDPNNDLTSTASSSSSPLPSLPKMTTTATAAMFLQPPSSAKDLAPNNTTAAWEMEAKTFSLHSSYVISQQKE